MSIENNAIAQIKEEPWIETIVRAFHTIDGPATYSQIYPAVESLRKNLPKNWKAIVRREIQEHSSDSESYTGNQDLFISINGIGEGTWGLKSEFEKEIIERDEENTLLVQNLIHKNQDNPYPEKVKSTSIRFKRDRSLVLHIKRLEKYKCQLCGSRFEIKPGEFFIEVHHIIPLSKNGKDISSNMIALCPNCHILCGFGLIQLNKGEHKISIHKLRPISPDSIEYHNNHIFKEKHT